MVFARHIVFRILRQGRNAQSTVLRGLGNIAVAFKHPGIHNLHGQLATVPVGLPRVLRLDLDDVILEDHVVDEVLRADDGGIVEIDGERAVAHGQIIHTRRRGQDAVRRNRRAEGQPGAVRVLHVQLLRQITEFVPRPFALFPQLPGRFQTVFLKDHGIVDQEVQRFVGVRRQVVAAVPDSRVIGILQPGQLGHRVIDVRIKGLHQTRVRVHRNGRVRAAFAHHQIGRVAGGDHVGQLGGVFGYAADHLYDLAAEELVEVLLRFTQRIVAQNGNGFLVLRQRLAQQIRRRVRAVHGLQHLLVGHFLLFDRAAEIQFLRERAGDNQQQYQQQGHEFLHFRSPFYLSGARGAFASIH